MRLLLFIWFVINLVYLFGFYAGYNAVEWWTCLPFVGATLVGSIVVFKIRTRKPHNGND